MTYRHSEAALSRGSSSYEREMFWATLFKEAHPDSKIWADEALRRRDQAVELLGVEAAQAAAEAMPNPDTLTWKEIADYWLNASGQA